MSHNPITGDKIATKPSKAYADNYDAIFRTADEERAGVAIAQCCPMCDVVEIDESAKD